MMQSLMSKVESTRFAAGNRSISIHPGLFDEPDSSGRIHLAGSKCEDCGQRMFPVRQRCVACYGATVVKLKLERIGKVDCFTTVRQSPPGYAGPVPYVLAMVALGNDVQVLAHLIGKRLDAWRSGDSVEACVLPLKLGSDKSRRILCYAFRPAMPQDMETSP